MNGLKQSLNMLREISSDIYHMYVPIIDSDTDISAIANPVLNVPEVYNEFYNKLINRIVYTQFLNKSYRNPFVILEGDRIPLGYAGQELYINPARGRQFNANDFAGLLMKYEADVKVQYTTINMNVQYPVTFSRQNLKQAFTSWDSLETFIDQLSNSLYNGAYIDEYNATRQLIAGAYKSNSAPVEIVTSVSDKETAEAFVEKARELFLNFQNPTSDYNAWSKVGGDGRPVITWTEPEDIVIILRNDIRSKIDVKVLAQAFNMSEAKLLGQMLTLKDFNIYNEDGTLNFDGSNILGILADKSWFRIKRQDMFMDSFYNPNNTSIQYYLNNIKMYNMSLFANGVIFATQEPTTVITEIISDVDNIEIDAGDTLTATITTKPFSANSPEITYTSGNTEYFTVAKDATNDKKYTITAVAVGTANLTISAGNVSKVISVTVSGS